MPLIALLLSKIETGNRNCIVPMQQEPAPAGSPGPQQDPALPHTPTMPPPESLSEGHQPNPSHSPTEVLLGLGRWGLGFVDLLGSGRGAKREGTLVKCLKQGHRKGKLDTVVLTFLAGVGVGRVKRGRMS